MAKRISSAMADFLAEGGSWKAALSDGTLEFYTGSQPASADAAPTGTLLCRLTRDGAAHTAETLATGLITLSGAAGSVDTVTIGGIDLLPAAVDFNTDLATTATAVATAINSTKHAHGFKATASGDTVTLTAPKGSGASINGVTLACTVTTLTAQINGGSSATIGGAGATAGVAAVNGLQFKNAVAGKVEKTTAAWRGTALSTNQAGWWRLKGHGAADDNTLDSINKKFFRYDGTCGTVGADMTLSNATFTEGADQTQSLFAITVPTTQDAA